MRILAVFLAALNMSVGALISNAQDRPAGSVTIYAATSLTDAFEALGDAYAEAHPEVDILLNFANSATLAAQIAAGAPADVFASANEFQMQKAVDSGRVEAAEVEIFAHNRLIVIVPADNPAAIEAPGDLAGDGILLVLAAAGTPIRAYTDAMLASYNADFGEDFNERVGRNLVSEESNVRQVVARVALGEADAGVVYQSDALGDVAARLAVIPIDERHNQLAAYPIAPLNDAAMPALARAFIDFVQSLDAQPILAANGFCWPAILDNAISTEATPEPNLAPAPEVEAPAIDCEAATIEDG